MHTNVRAAFIPVVEHSPLCDLDLLSIGPKAQVVLKFVFVQGGAPQL